MNKPAACVLTLLALAAPAALGENDFLPSAALTDAGLVKFWQLQLPLEADQQIVDGFRVDDVLYLTTNDGYAFAVHAHSGAIRWLRQVTPSGYRLRAPCHAAGNTIFVTPTRAVYFDQLSGAGVYELDLNNPAGSSVATDGLRWFFGSLNQRFYAFDVQGAYEVWKTTTNGPIASTPVVHGDYVYFASDDGGVYSCTSRDKRLHWSAATNGPNTADLVANESGIYVASRDQSLYLLDLQFGQPRWRVRFGGPLFEPPVITPKVAYQFCPDDGVVAIDVDAVESEDRERWKLPRGRRVLTVHEKHVFVQSRDGTLIVADDATGDILHTIATPGFEIGIPAALDQAIFLASGDGRLVCARPKGAKFARREELRKALLTANAAASQPAAEQPTKRRPTIATFEIEPRRPGPLVGGKSKISRTMLGEKSVGERKPPRPADAPAPGADEKPAEDEPTSRPASPSGTDQPDDDEPTDEPEAP